MTYIWNAKLEVGEYTDELGCVRTDTNLYHIKIKDDKIEDIIDAKEMTPTKEGFDAQGRLLLPAFKEMHNHLDKTYLSQEWKACIPAKNLEHRLALEAEELEELVDSLEERASTMIERHINNGVNHIRTHVNIDPFIKLKNLEGVKRALDKYAEFITYDIVAFPQHGLLKHSEMPNLLREALESGATMLGGLDPAGIDKNIEKSLQITMDIAKEYQVDVDMHFHDRGKLGYYTMDKWLDMVEEQDYQGKTSFSHAFGIAHNDSPAFLERLKEHKVSILSTAPIGLKSTLIPIDNLQAHGIYVGLGCDGFYDSWSPFVSGDLVDKVKGFVEYTNKITEQDLRQSLALITNGITPLDREGNKLWPNVNDEASFVLVDADSSAHLIAKAKDQNNRILINKGKIFQTQ